MAQDRLSFDLAGLREDIETHSDTPEWQELSMAKRIRLLIRLGLNAGVEDEKKQSVYGVLTALCHGQHPGEPDMVIAAQALDVDIEQLYVLVHKVLENGSPSSETTHHGH